MGEDSRNGRKPEAEQEREPSGAQFVRAAQRGELRSFMVTAVRRGRWDVVTQLLAFARRPTVSLEGLGELVEALETGLGLLSEERRKRALADDDTRALVLEAGESLRSRLRLDPVPPHERRWLALAARAFVMAHDHWRAAETFERAGQFEQAADSWGALGEIEAMERALGRAEEERAATRGPVLLWREALAAHAHGDRVHAWEVLKRLPPAHAHAAEARRLAHELTTLLVRGPVALETATRDVLRLAPTPMTLGRDPGAGLPLRDPAVSRRHAQISWRERDEAFLLEDLGSRTGTRVGPAALGEPLLLGDAGSFALGPTCPVSYERVAPRVLRLHVPGGFDRGLVALVGPGPLPLGASGLSGFAAIGDATVSFLGGQARWQSPPGTRTWLGEAMANPAVDLLHGDRLRVEPLGVEGGLAVICGVL